MLSGIIGVLRQARANSVVARLCGLGLSHACGKPISPHSKRLSGMIKALG